MTGVVELVEKIDVVSTESKLSKALSIIGRSPLRAVVVSPNAREFLGMVDDRGLLDFHENPERTKCESICQRTPFASESTTPEELIMSFLETHSRAIPFLKKTIVVGGISRTNCLKLLLPTKAIEGKRVSDYMSHSNSVISEDSTAQQARKKMRELGVFHLSVVSPSGRLSGVVSSYDIATKVIPHQRESHRESTFAPQQEEGVEMESVSSIMHVLPQTTSPDAPLRKALQQMISQNVSALLVVDGSEKPLGLLSVRDALHSVLKPSPEPVFVYGLRDDEKSMAESIKQLASSFLEKFGKKLSADYLAIHVKSFLEGKKRRYAIKGKLSIRGRLYSASTPETSAHRSVWDLHLAVKEVLEELSRIASDRAHSRPRSLKRRKSGAEEE